MVIKLPELVMVLLVGIPGSGKSSFARRYFKTTEILSSDFFRAMICDDPSDQTVNAGAFELLHLACSKRLIQKKLTVIDATNTQAESRREFLHLAKRFNVPVVAIVIDLPVDRCVEWDQQRPDRHVGTSVILHQRAQFEHSLHRLGSEGFLDIHVLTSVEQLSDVQFERVPLTVNKKDARGPFDLIGDVHGCYEELCDLLRKLGYEVTAENATPPPGRTAVFMGDLVDRGPNTPGVLKLVMSMLEAGHALCVRGNHDDKLCRKLKGRHVKVTHGLEQSLAQLEACSLEFISKVQDFLEGLVSHYVLDDGRLIVAHAGMKEKLQGRESERVWAFALYGEVTGETDHQGLPVRLNWAADYTGQAIVVYGHTPVEQPKWLNRTICIDTGCVFGGALTALRYPENELLSVPARRRYCEPKRPFTHE